jgi:hypothetical protein
MRAKKQQTKVLALTLRLFGPSSFLDDCPHSRLRTVSHSSKLNRHKDSWLQTFAVFWILHSFLWVIPRCLNFTEFLFTWPTNMEQFVPKHRHVHTTNEDGTGCSKSSARSHNLWRWNRVFQNVDTQKSDAWVSPKKRIKEYTWNIKILTRPETERLPHGNNICSIKVSLAPPELHTICNEGGMV